MQKDCLKKLNLTDAQDKQIQALRDKMSDKRSDKKRGSPEIILNQEGFKALMNAANFDEAKAKQLLTTQKGTSSELQIERLKLQHQMAQILTPEQRAQTETCSTEGKNKEGSNSKNRSKNNKK
ncbi:hypothetical protein AwWohl_07720 [Gammaproteobacteria bacterium]|nr:hypothetical protein AwWohl_07720 [Gammaproteobacteria bacterium]